MTTTAYFPGSAAPSASKQAVPASKTALKAPQAAAAGKAISAYPWLTAAIRSKMSARALRLMRADY